MEVLKKEIRSGPLIGIDETTVQVLNEPGRSNTTKSYMWVFRGGPPEQPVLLYLYNPTRAGQVPMDLLAGYENFIQTDGYSGYDELGRQAGIHHVGCWAHARRMFIKVIDARKKGKKSKGGIAETAVDYIRDLYAIEREARAENLDFDQIYILRQDKAKPILTEFKEWLVSCAGTTPPQGLLGKAIPYNP